MTVRLIKLVDKLLYNTQLVYQDPEDIAIAINVRKIVFRRSIGTPTATPWTIGGHLR